MNRTLQGSDMWSPQRRPRRTNAAWAPDMVSIVSVEKSCNIHGNSPFLNRHVSIRYASLRNLPVNASRPMMRSTFLIHGATRPSILLWKQIGSLCLPISASSAPLTGILSPSPQPSFCSISGWSVLSTS